MKYNVHFNSLNITIDEQFTGKTVSEFLDYFLINKKKSGKLLAENGILINHQTVKDTSTVLYSKDTLTLISQKKEIDYPLAEKECEVVYEDDFVYVAHKPAGIIIHDDKDNECLANQAAAYQYNHGMNVPVRYIHRLDRETIGLVLFVKQPLFQSWFDEQLRQRNISRRYLAITTGKGKPGQKYTFNQKIGKDRHVNNRYRVSSTGKQAITKAVVKGCYRDYLLFECALLTGRTHQIRVHLANSAHPIVNDEIYGFPSKDFSSMGLWAYQISFQNPLTEETITVNDYPNPDYRVFKNI